MRRLDTIIIHCSDSDHPEHDNIATIKEWHIARGFKDVGYHFFIRKDGTKENGRSVLNEGAHCEGNNKSSIGICLSGKKEFTEAQFTVASQIVCNLMILYNIPMWAVRPHCHFTNQKTCPNFDVFQEILRRIYERETVA